MDNLVSSDSPAIAPSRQPLPLMRRAAFILLAAVVIIAFTEAALRFALGLGNPVLIAPDSACEYILKPDQHIYRFFSHTDTNRFGMRSSEVGPHAPGTLRLLFVGDSIPYGTSQVDQSRIFTELLHRDLPSIVHQPVEVLNASAGAWAIDNELSYVRSRGFFNADIVLLVLNSGDLAQPRSTIADVGDGLPVARPATAMGELWMRYLRPRLFHSRRHIDAGDSANLNADDVVKSNLEKLDAFRGLADAAHARFAIIYAPFRHEVPNISAKPTAILSAWAAGRRVPLLDLTAAELPYSEREITLDGAHFNVKGNQVIAEAIERGWPSVMSPR